MRAGCDMRRGREESGEGRGDRERKKEERGIMEREVREEEIEEVCVVGRRAGDSEIRS